MRPELSLVLLTLLGGPLGTQLRGQATSRLVRVGAQPGGHSVSFLNSVDGWIYNRGAIWRTRNGGMTWSPVAFPLPLGLEEIPPGLIDVHFGSATTGWIWVDNSKDYPGIIEEQSVYRTTNDGRDWTEEPPSPLASSGAGQTTLFYLAEGVIGWQGGFLPTGAGRNTKCKNWLGPMRLVVFHTEDAGAHWSEQFLPGASACQVDLLSFRDAMNGVAVAGHDIYYTRNGGATWMTSEFLSCCTDADWRSTFSLPPASVFFLDDKDGWLGYEDGYVFNTVDGGTTWREISRPGDAWTKQIGLGAGGTLFFTSPRHGFVLGGDRAIYETGDGGDNWSILESKEPITWIDCVAGAHCWALGEKSLYRIDSE